MSLETAQYIHQLVETNPTIQDYVKEGDDHLRLVKAALKNTFPNIKGPVSVSHTALNNIPADTNAVLNKLLQAIIPRGACIPFDIANNPTIPTGFSLCDGSLVPDYGVVPDLRDRFVLGWGDEAAGTLGGKKQPLALEAGAHTPVIKGTILTEAQGAIHRHTTIEVMGSNADNGDPGGLVVTAATQANGLRALQGASTNLSAGGEPHTHEAEPVSHHGHLVEYPLYLRMIWICRTGTVTLS